MHHKSVLIITQARMSSTRLPGKILMEAAGSSMLEHHVKRLSELSANVVVATSNQPADDVIESWCLQHNVAVFRGDELDVLDRFYHAHLVYGGDIVVRVTSDCPLIDPNLIAKGVALYKSTGNDHCYVSNCFPRTFARGF
ncbi:MAG: cytidylyltransferase domain-containing protein, partial [Flavobacteriales bacterium]